MGARLIVVSGPLRNSEVVLTESESLIGREPGASICLNSRSVSRRHCIIRRHGDSYVLEDLGSHNGTLVNDRPITRHTLQHGDQIAIGDSALLFIADGAEPFRAEVNETRETDALTFATVQLAEPL